MNDFTVTIPLDVAFDWYQFGKRVISKEPVYCYNSQTNEFMKIKGELKENCIPFINSYAVCCGVIDQYLELPHIKKYKEDCLKSIKNGRYRNKIVDFLWFFEHIDGCMEFGDFEVVLLTKILKKWCKKNGFSYLDAKVYVVEGNYSDTWGRTIFESFPPTKKE